VEQIIGLPHGRVDPGLDTNIGGCADEAETELDTTLGATGCSTRLRALGPDGIAGSFERHGLAAGTGHEAFGRRPPREGHSWL